MEKEPSLSDRLAAKATSKNHPLAAKNKATFLALKPDIKKALDDSWPIKTIWKLLHDEGKVDFSYQAFRGYVNRLILTQNDLEKD